MRHKKKYVLKVINKEKTKTTQNHINITLNRAITIIKLLEKNNIIILWEV